MLREVEKGVHIILLEIDVKIDQSSIFEHFYYTKDSLFCLMSKLKYG